MKVSELITRLESLPGDAVIELIVWQRDDEDEPGLRCNIFAVQPDGDKIYIQGAGEPEDAV